MKYRAAIFDLDGTLVDSIHGIAYAMNSVLKKHGFPIHTVDSYKHFVGYGQKVLVKRALPEDSVKYGTLHAFTAEMVVAYEQFWMYNMSVYSGIVPLLEYLTASGVDVNVNTNKNEKSTLLILKEYLPSITFSNVIAGDTLKTRKPDPEGVKTIALKSGATIDEFVYIGDSEVDIQTAKNAGMDCISVLWGFRTKEELLAAGAVCCVKRPEEITEIINGR